jgi:hypothetical protein
VRGRFSDGRRRSNEEGGFRGRALALRLVPTRNNRDGAQNWQGMSRNRWSITEYRDTNRAAAGVAGRGCMGVSNFQRIKDQNQQYAAQRDPAPEPARLELTLVDDTHSPVLSDDRNIARVNCSINPGKRHETVLRPQDPSWPSARRGVNKVP